MNNFKTPVIVCIATLLFCMPLSLIAQEKKTAEQPKQDKDKVVEVGNKLCLIYPTEAIVEGKTVDYKGKRYNFCCGSCTSEFENNPEKYIAKYEASIKKETLKDAPNEAGKSDQPATTQPSEASQKKS